MLRFLKRLFRSRKEESLAEKRERAYGYFKKRVLDTSGITPVMIGIDPGKEDMSVVSAHITHDGLLHLMDEHEFPKRRFSEDELVSWYRAILSTHRYTQNIFANGRTARQHDIEVIAEAHKNILRLIDIARDNIKAESRLRRFTAGWSYNRFGEKTIRIHPALPVQVSEDGGRTWRDSE